MLPLSLKRVNIAIEQANIAIRQSQLREIQMEASYLLGRCMHTLRSYDEAANRYHETYQLCQSNPEALLLYHIDKYSNAGQNEGVLNHLTTYSAKVQQAKQLLEKQQTTMGGNIYSAGGGISGGSGGGGSLLPSNGPGNTTLDLQTTVALGFQRGDHDSLATVLTNQDRYVPAPIFVSLAQALIHNAGKQKQKQRTLIYLQRAVIYLEKAVVACGQEFFGQRNGFVEFTELGIASRECH